MSRVSSFLVRWHGSRLPPSALALGLALQGACQGGSGAGVEDEISSTHHGVFYGIVTNGGGAPVSGVTVSLSITQHCPCEPVEVRELSSTRTTGNDGMYRNHFELALPEPVPAGLVLELLAVPSVSSGLQARIDTVSWGSPLTSALDSTRHDMTLTTTP